MTSCLHDLIYRIHKGPRLKPMVALVDRLKNYQKNTFDNWLAKPKTKGAIPTKGKSAKQHVPKSAAAKGLGGAPAAAEGAGERPCWSQRKPAWTDD